MAEVTELKIKLSRGKTSTSGEHLIAACLIGWHTDEGEKLMTSKILHGKRETISNQVSHLVDRLLNELPRD